MNKQVCQRPTFGKMEQYFQHLNMQNWISYLLSSDGVPLQLPVNHSSIVSYLTLLYMINPGASGGYALSRMLYHMATMSNTVNLDRDLDN